MTSLAKRREAARNARCVRLSFSRASNRPPVRGSSGAGRASLARVVSKFDVRCFREGQM